MIVLFAVGLLIAFVIILGDFSWQKGYVVYVDYDNAAGLKPGADVAISGIKAGRVERIDFLGGEHDPEVNRRVFVRVKVVLEDERAPAVRTWFRHHFDREPPRLQLTLTVESVQAVIAAVQQGMGCGVVPAHTVAAEVERQRLDSVAAKLDTL